MVGSQGCAPRACTPSASGVGASWAGGDPVGLTPRTVRRKGTGMPERLPVRLRLIISRRPGAAPSVGSTYSWSGPFRSAAAVRTPLVAPPSNQKTRSNCRRLSSSTKGLSGKPNQNSYSSQLASPRYSVANSR